MTVSDLDKPVKVLMLDGYERTWRSCWRKRPVWRLVFAGHIDQSTHRMNAPSSMTLVSAEARLLRRHCVRPL